MPRAWKAALCLALAASSVSASEGGTPYAVQDLLALESVGQVRIDPREKLIVVERRRPYNTARDFSYAAFVPRLLSNILATSLNRPGALRPLFRQEQGAGYWMGDFSPSGRRLSVFRLANRRLDLGVVDMATRRVMWLPVAPDLPIAHPAPSWIDDSTLVVVAMTRRQLPFVLTLGNRTETDLRNLWNYAAKGQRPSSTTQTTSGLSPMIAEREVVRIDLRTGRRDRLARGDITDVSVSRGGAVAIVAAVSPVTPPAAGSLSPAFVPLRHSLSMSFSSSNAISRVSDDVLPANLSWDPSGRRLAFVRLEGSDWARARWQVATIDGEIVSSRDVLVLPQAAISQGSGLLARSRWAGERLLLQGRTTVAGGGWYSVDPGRPRDAPVRIGDGQLVFADAAGAWINEAGLLWRVAPGSGARGMSIRAAASASTTSLDPSSTGARLLYNPVEKAVAVRIGATLRIIDAAGLSSGSVSAPSGARLVAVSRRAAVTFEEHPDGVGSLMVASVGGGGGREIARINGFLATRAAPREMRLRTGSSDGMEHASWLFLPTAPTCPVKPPLITLVYPGAVYDGDAPDVGAPSLFAPMTSVPILVGRCFAVLVPSLPEADSTADLLGRLASDADSALDAALATDLVDQRRVALLGHSFGGLGALGIATRSSRYTAVVVASGPYDLAAIYRQVAGPDRMRFEMGLPFVSGAGWAEGGQGALGVPPWKAPDRYVSRSPFFSLDKIMAPALIIGAETDYVGLEQAEGAFMGLARLGRDATLLRYWGEGHVLASPANIRDYWSRIFAWLDVRLRLAPSSVVGAHHCGRVGRHRDTVQQLAHASHVASMTSAW